MDDVQTTTADNTTEMRESITATNEVPLSPAETLTQYGHQLQVELATTKLERDSFKNALDAELAHSKELGAAVEALRSELSRINATNIELQHAANVGYGFANMVNVCLDNDKVQEKLFNIVMERLSESQVFLEKVNEAVGEYTSEKGFRNDIGDLIDDKIDNLEFEVTVRNYR